jgi:adenine-specific DNA-methyltransferase
MPNAGTIVWDKKNPMLGRKGVATQHEYVIYRAWDESPIYLRSPNIAIILKKAQSLIGQYGGVTEKVRSDFSKWIATYPEFTGGDRAYKFIDDGGKVYRGVAMGAPESRTDPKFHIPLIHPISKKECPIPPNGWSRTPETLQILMGKGDILFGIDETVQPQRKVFLTEESKRQISSVISDARRGKADVDNLGLEFPYCHPVSLYEELLGAALSNKNDDIGLDFFAGSGTTGHAVINLNREDKGNRRFILVEMEYYFDTVLLPRIKKVTFTPEWKDGKPVRQPTAQEIKYSPRILKYIKYIKLESYEDALNNIAFKEAPKTLYDFDDYLLKYILDWETKESDTFLSVAKLASPFTYKLNITEKQESKEKAVDLPETFAYLLGLHVNTRRVYNDNGRRYLVYRGNIDHREIAVIWRDIGGWADKDFSRDKEFVVENKLSQGADEVLVNGESLIPNANSLDPIFKSRMFGA